jgi:hypothetical protein
MSAFRKQSASAAIQEQMGSEKLCTSLSSRSPEKVFHFSFFFSVDIAEPYARMSASLKR